MTPARYRLKVLSVLVARDPSVPGERITNAKQAADIARAMIPDDDREHFGVVLLSAANKVLGWYEASTGGMGSTTVDSRVIFGAALLSGAVALILVHNHPSGEPRASADDENITRVLQSGAKILGYQLLDHVIIGSGTDKHYSFHDAGALLAEIDKEPTPCE